MVCRYNFFFELKVEIITDDDIVCDLKFKIIVIGDCSVGKTSLISNGTKNIFKEDYSPTISFEILNFNIKINDKIIKLEFWDTCGQEEFKSLVKQFYKNSALAMLVYSIDSKKSFDDIKSWLHEVKSESNPNIKIFLIGNKTDLEDERQVQLKDANTFMNENKFDFFCETSAKNGLNVKKLFIQAAKLLYNEHLKYKERALKQINNIPIPVPVKIDKNKSKKKQGCC